MKKLVLFCALSGIFSYGIAQSEEPRNHGKVVSEVAKETEPGKGKGKVVSEVAKSKEKKEKKEGRKNGNMTQNHGQDVKSAAQDPAFQGKEKGAYVKSVATAHGQQMRSARHVQHKGPRMQSAKRPVMARRHMPTGRPGK
jgi:hypothetical protein